MWGTMSTPLRLPGTGSSFQTLDSLLSGGWRLERLDKNVAGLCFDVAVSACSRWANSVTGHVQRIDIQPTDALLGKKAAPQPVLKPRKKLP